MVAPREAPLALQSRNPFQGGVGFSTRVKVGAQEKRLLCRNPFQGGVGFSTRSVRVGCGFVGGRNPFQGGVGFSTQDLVLEPQGIE